ncbi:uncharacterized protein LOC132895376 isoform X2 [Neoarius graeffei]|uniref:uncharacterized protein LOC132895376 isoform X2 n=1 Tax=Neoarius graeffei TaxID=443677 RepID=UPI00298C3DD6|nr:uncharacterized protein LOC132895376 isoform X2 [Neoarius graeffei]
MILRPYRPAAMVEGRERPIEGATLDAEQSAVENIEPCPASVTPEHFGAFDSSLSLYSGFDNSTLTSPQRPAMSQTGDCTTQTTLNISDIPSEPADGPSASNQSEDDFCQDILTRQATAIILTAREKHHLSQAGVNEVVAGMQQHQALLVTNLRS